MSWVALIPALALAAALLVLPGLVVALCARLRGFVAVALAPALSTTIVSVGAILAGPLALGWSVWVVIMMTVVLAPIAYAVSRLVKPGSPVLADGRRARPRWWVASVLILAVAAGAVLIGRRLVRIFGTPEAISQTFDNVFHLNAVQFILQTGLGSSLDVGRMAGNTFYPAAWHDVVALVAMHAGVSIPAAVNSANLAISAVVWPLGIVLLTRQIIGPRTVPTLSAGVLSAAFGAFPILMLDYGVLYPNLLAIALLPAGLTVVLQLLRLGTPTRIPGLTNFGLLLAVLPGLSLAHPSAAMALLGLAVAPAFAVVLRTFQSRKQGNSHAAKYLSSAAFLAYLAVLGVLWKLVRPVETASTWQPIQTTSQAIGEVLTGGSLGRPLTWMILVLTIFGSIAVLRRRIPAWAAGLYLITAFWYVVVSSFPTEAFRMFITGVWYNDSPRLAALLPLTAVPLCAAGADYLVSAARAMLSGPLTSRQGGLRTGSLRPRAVTSANAIGALALTGLLTAGTQGGNVRAEEAHAHGSYIMNAESPLLSPDELALLQRLDSEVPPDAKIASNPWTGTPLAYAVSNRQTLQLHILEKITPEESRIFNHLNDALTTDPGVCRVVRQLDVGYVLDFEGVEVHGGDHGYVGLDNLVENGVARLVDQEGDARLLEITAC